MNLQASSFEIRLEFKMSSEEFSDEYSSSDDSDHSRSDDSSGFRSAETNSDESESVSYESSSSSQTGKSSSESDDKKGDSESSVLAEQKARESLALLIKISSQMEHIVKKVRKLRSELLDPSDAATSDHELGELSW